MSIAVGRDRSKRSLGTFDCEEQAARTFDTEARLTGVGLHSLNFPMTAEEHAAVVQAAAPVADDEAVEPNEATKGEIVDEAIVEANEALVEQRKAAGEQSSQFTGVAWHKAMSKWQAQQEAHTLEKHISTQAQCEALRLLERP